MLEEISNEKAAQEFSCGPEQIKRKSDPIESILLVLTIFKVRHMLQKALKHVALHPNDFRASGDPWSTIIMMLHYQTFQNETVELTF